MMTKTRIILVGLAILAISAFGLLKATKADVSFLDKIAQIAGQVVGNAVSEKVNSSGALDNLNAEDLTFSAIPGNEVQGTELIVNGVTTYTINLQLVDATTTLAAFKNPAGAATSSLRELFGQIDTGTSTASTLVFATSTTAFATSSVPFTPARTVAANAKDSFVWTPATGYNANGAIIGPNEWVLLRTEAAGEGGYTYKGSLKAKLVKLK